MSLYSYDDRQLWQTYLSGDNHALGILAERYYRTLRRYGLKFGVDASVAEDCIQDLFLELGQNRHRINDTNSVKFYLLKALRNNVLQYLRYQQRFLGNDQDWMPELPDYINAEALLIEKETLSDSLFQLKTLMETLPKREREVLYLRYYENLSVAEISEIMGINRQSVSNFLQKALSKLRTKWLVTMVLYLNIF
ncbi:RNA polymerase sigma factor [Dyadobacter pollutisoli]|uniref:Sigma-70 family RNA polymerase sigma factor n=1 Tax=Dyadobacter pollutisoli TaxID=2910158 RepID=A0A9E8NCK7_9BACT|nr:sigma-70 family RNA polymerase sigma factor [Dyadobacter pollutisoli]WAC13523.1 sigma-70 family RNA polymerase sigma factor [Dyadobacter pollutisoli]